MSNIEPMADALALAATEHWRAARRLLRLASDLDPARLPREEAALRFGLNQLHGAMETLGMRISTFDGMVWTPEIPVEPVNADDFEDEAGLVVHETLEPTVLFNGRILRRGKVVLRKGDA
jgi:hypothetical protein